jgi:hypothetical protein
MDSHIVQGAAALPSAYDRWHCPHNIGGFRLGLFLDWAVTAGLMHYSGLAYQYRHRELQHWLRQHPQPPSTP